MAALFVIELHDGFLDGLVEVFEAGEGLVDEVMPLHIAPSLLDVVEFRSVLWQPFDTEPVRPLGECGCGCLAGDTAGELASGLPIFQSGQPALWV
jgi:hypothetical protein